MAQAGRVCAQGVEMMAVFTATRGSCPCMGLACVMCSALLPSLLALDRPNPMVAVVATGNAVHACAGDE
jgi:hypothetical protein